MNLQRRYLSLTREKCGNAQSLGADIKNIHAEKALLDPDCVTSETKRTFFFNALGPEYESFRDHKFRQMGLVNVRDENGSITRAAPTFDYIENKAIEEEHQKGQWGTQPTTVRTLPAFALIQGPGDKKLIPSSGELSKGFNDYAYDKAYDNALSRIQGQLGEQTGLAMQTLSWLACARRPLTSVEHQHALAIEEEECSKDEENLPEIEDILAVCAGLVTVEDASGIIRLVHYIPRAEERCTLPQRREWNQYVMCHLHLV